MELHISDYLRNTTRIPGNAYKVWRQKKIREIREHIEYLVKRRNIMAPNTTEALSNFYGGNEGSVLNGYNTKWITQGWIDDLYVEHDEDFSDLFNSTSPSHETIKDIQKLKT